MKKLFGTLFLFFVLVLLLIPSQKVYSQKGFYVQPFFMYQYTNLSNRDDRLKKSNNYFQFVSTYKPAFGARTIYNFTNAVGLETGVKYSQQGQKYKGFIEVDGNTGDTVNQNFSSELKLNYLQIPLMLSFNSNLANIDEDLDKLYMSIAIGIQLDCLLNASMSVNPGIDSFSIKYPNAQSQFNNLYNNFNLSFAANVSLNWQLKHGWQVNTTLCATKSLGDVENKDFKYDKTQYPVEYQFPVGIKKEAVTTDVRYKAKNVVYGLMVGVSYRLYH